MRCNCGHRAMDHMKNGRGRCTGSVRMYIRPIASHLLEPGDRGLDKAEAQRVVNEASEKVDRAPSYEKEFLKMLKRGYVKIDCPCEIFHTLDLPSEDSGVKLYGPSGSPVA